MWQQIGICPEWQCDERLWHAGLSEDGRRCFVAGFEDNIYIVWDIGNQCVIWRNDDTEGDSEIPPLAEWIDSKGFITLASSGPAGGRYRIFGLDHNYAKIESTALQQVLHVDVEGGKVLVRQAGTKAVLHELPFDAFSGDWAFASFSENDAVIAVLEPYSVTFFGQHPGTSP